jgi:DNA-directed RNA polymerase subunit F
VRGVVEDATERFCEVFEEVEERVVEGDEGVDEEEEDAVLLREVFPRTSGEIRVLLS